MNRMLTTTIIAGSVIGAGIALMAQDKKTQKSIIQGSKKLVNKATDAMDDMTNMVK